VEMALHIRFHPRSSHCSVRFCKSSLKHRNETTLTFQIFFPDTPYTTKAFYLNEWERNRARERIDEEGRTPVGKMDVSAFKRIFLSWQLWTFSIA
jgi:hypothetical protein